MFRQALNNCELDGGSYLERDQMYNQCMKAIWLSDMISFSLQLSLFFVRTVLSLLLLLSFYAFALGFL